MLATQMILAAMFSPDGNSALFSEPAELTSSRIYPQFDGLSFGEVHLQLGPGDTQIAAVTQISPAGLRKALGD